MKRDEVAQIVAELGYSRFTLHLAADGRVTRLGVMGEGDKRYAFYEVPAWAPETRDGFIAAVFLPKLGPSFGVPDRHRPAADPAFRPWRDDVWTNKPHPWLATFWRWHDSWAWA
jgi:hypothetical protein